MTARLFTSDGLSPQEASWSVPSEISDNSILEIQYSSVLVPLNPELAPENWDTSPDESTIWLAQRIIRNGVEGSWNVTRIRGVDAPATITGYLTNESHTVAATEAGSVISLDGSGGFFKVFEGTTDVSSSAAFSVLSSVGVTVGIASTGEYTISAVTGTDGGYATLRAVYNTVVIDKVYSITKSKTGISAKLLTLESDGQLFSKDQSGVVTPSEITFTATLQNISGTVVWTATRYLANGTGSPATLTGAGNSRTLAATEIDGYTRVVVEASVTDGDTYSDTISAVLVQDGMEGESTIFAYLTNESHVVSASSSGVVPSFEDAGGEFVVFSGVTNVTSSSSFSVVSANGVNISINADGEYTISGMTIDTGSAILRATYDGVSVDRVYSIAKSRQGADGANGQSGAGFYGGVYASIDFTHPVVVDRFTTIAGRPPVEGDIFVQTLADESASEGRQFIDSDWVEPSLFIDGSIIAKNTIAGDKIQAGTSISAPAIIGGIVELPSTDTLQVMSATPFGTNNLIYWYGPKNSTTYNSSTGRANVSNLTKENAVSWRDASGDYSRDAITRRNSNTPALGSSTTRVSVTHPSQNGNISITAGGKIRIDGSQNFAQVPSNMTMTVAYEIRQGSTVLKSSFQSAPMSVTNSEPTTPSGFIVDFSGSVTIYDVVSISPIGYNSADFSLVITSVSTTGTNGTPQSWRDVNIATLETKG